jgi:hypothetical protein
MEYSGNWDVYPNAELSSASTYICKRSAQKRVGELNTLTLPVSVSLETRERVLDNLLSIEALCLFVEGVFESAGLMISGSGQNSGTKAGSSVVLAIERCKTLIVDIETNMGSKVLSFGQG